MSNVVVVDASIVLKWVLYEPDSAKAQALLIEWNKKKVATLAPALLIYEVTNTLYRNARKGEITFERAKKAQEEILLAKVALDFSPDFKLSLRAIELADRFNLPATYDSHYLALAEREGCELWTADTRLWNSIKGKLTWVRWMGDYSAS